MKRNVYFNEFNVLMGNTIYLPLVSGLLQSYALKSEAIEKNYSFMPFLFIRDYPGKIIAMYENPSVAAFSVSMWNINLSLIIAEEIKKRFPGCLIVFGGPNIPFNTVPFLHKYPFIDVAVKGEGEQAFCEVLIRFLDSRDFGDIPGVSYHVHRSNSVVNNDKHREGVKDLDIFPSPYLEGAFEYLLPEDIFFQAIIETNRGCPYSCSFCFWGKGGLNKKFRLFSLDRIKQIADWCGKNRIKYLFCADSNFGIFERDIEIANYFVQAKIRYGYPDKFRVCYAKNSKESVYEIGKLLNKYDMDKGVTLSRQTNSPEALENVGRKNFKISVFNEWQKRYNNDNIPVYSELILGLPGETYESFISGIEDTLRSGYRNQVFVYLCQVYPNTELSNQEYQKRFQITTTHLLLTETHGAARPHGSVPEFENIIISTSSMPLEDWKRMVVFSWTFQLFHGLKLGYFILLYIADRYNINLTKFIEYIAMQNIKSDRVSFLRGEIAIFYNAVESILKGSPRMRILPETGDIYWEQEEASYLNVISNKMMFYSEMLIILKEYLDDAGISYNEDELEEVVLYQNLIVPDLDHPEDKKVCFTYNIPGYFADYFSENKKGIEKKQQFIKIRNNKDYKGDMREFARDIVLYGRKSNRMLREVSWNG